MIKLPGIKLTAEQKAVVESCPVPSLSNVNGKLIRVTAAAGAGKTTVLLALALQAVKRGHSHIGYLTYSKAAAEDGKARLQDALRTAGKEKETLIEATTLHSKAQRLLNLRLGKQVSDLWDDAKLQAWISLTLNDAIEHFLQSCYREIEGKKVGMECYFPVVESAKTRKEAQEKIEKKRRAREKVDFLSLQASHDIFARVRGLSTNSNRDQRAVASIFRQRNTIRRAGRVLVERSLVSTRTSTRNSFIGIPTKPVSFFN
jgi:superfamily I DNA/RNA helicase